MNKDLSSKKKQLGTYLLNEKQWEHLYLLMHHGYPFSIALKELVKEDHPILLALKNGVSMEQILRQGKGYFYTHLSFFFHVTSLEEAILCALEMKQWERSVFSLLGKKLAYPLFVLVSAYVLLFFFSYAILPQMIQSFETIEAQGMFFLIGCMQLLVYASCLFLILLFLGFLIVHKSKPYRLKWYHFAMRTKLLQSWCSYQLSGYLITLNKKGISTQHSFAFLKNHCKQETVTICSAWIEEQLKQGIAFQEVIQTCPFLSKNIKQHFFIGQKINQMETFLSMYMEQQKEEWLQQIKKWTVYIQLFSYGFVALLVILVYQMMLLPLSMLETM